jgi:ribonuclease-3
MLADSNLEELERELGIKFADTSLLLRALTHDSSLNERRYKGQESNERLEFLGDSVLDLVVSNHGYGNVPGGERELHDHWEKLANQKSLAEAADRIQLTKFMRLSEGERRKSPIEESIRAGAYEAIVGAIFVSRGYKIAAEFVNRTLISYSQNP